MRNGDRPTGKQIGDHIRKVCAALPPGIKQIYGRADSGFYCWDAVEAYEEFHARFVISARNTSRLAEQLRQAEWKPSRSWERRFDRMEEVVSSNLTTSTKSLFKIPQRRSEPRIPRFWPAL